MTYLSRLAAADPELARRLADLSVSGRGLARELGTNEASVRRYRRNLLQRPASSGAPQHKYRNGAAQWVPGSDLGQDEGEVRTVPFPAGTEEPADADLLREMSIDPEEWEAVSRRESHWQKADGEWLRAFRISVRRRSRRTGGLSAEQMSEILASYPSRSGGVLPPAAPDWDNRVFVVPVGDLQAGKIDGGGTAALIERFAELTAIVKHRLESAGGTKRLVLPWLGDCIEGIISQGGRLATRLDISVTEQVRVYRRLMLHQIAALSPEAEHVIVIVVPGNHDETTRQFATSPDDSWAIEGASAVQDALELSGRYPHVTFLYPEPEELTVTLDIGSDDHAFVLGFTHGHLAGSPAKALDWWKNQSHGRQLAGQADMLFTGHFHHLRAEATGGGRTWVQIPALDGGSAWFRRSKGADEPSGMVSLWVTPGRGNGWEGLTVHR